MARTAKARVYIDADASGVARGTRQAEAALKRLDRTGSRSLKSLSREARGIAPRLTGAIAGFTSLAGAAALLKDSVQQTEALAKGTALLSRTTGESTQEASRWVAVAKVRGVEVTKLNRSFVTLSKAIVAANDGSEKQAKLFKQLGVTQAELAKGDISSIMGDIADAFGRMPDGAQKAAAAQQLFGRNAASLVPLLNKGSQALREQLALSDKYGTTLSRKQVAESLRAAAAQRELNLAMLGLKVQLGQAVIPALTAGITKLTTFVAQMRSGEGAGGRFAAKMKDIWQTMGPLLTGFVSVARRVGEFVGKHPALQKIVGTMLALGLAVKAVSFAAQITGIGRLIQLAGTLGSVGTAGGTSLAANLMSGFRTRFGAGKSITTKVGGVVLNAGSDAGAAGGAAAASKFGSKFKSGLPGAVRGIAASATWAAIGASIGAVLAAAIMDQIGQKLQDLISGGNNAGGNPYAPNRGNPTQNAWSIVKDVLGFRQGGMVYRAGGLVPSLLSPGEVVIPPGGGALRVPGAPVPADNVPMMLPSGSAVLTWDGQARMMAGQPLAGAVASQAPHFRTGGFASPTKVGASMFTASGEAGGYRGTLNRHPWAYAELSRKWHDWSALGDLPLGYKLAVSYGNRTVVAGKHDVGQGGGPVGGYHRSIDLLAPVARYLRLPGLGVVSIQSTDAPEGTKGPAALGSGRGASRSTPRTVRWQTYQPPGRTTGRVSRAAWEAGWQSGLSDPFGWGRAQERTDDYNTARARLFGVWTSHSRTIPARRAPTQHPSAGGTGRAARVVRWAKSQLGYHEGPGNQNRYGPSAPWCGYFVQAGLKNAGLSISRGMGYVPDIRNMISAGAAPFSGPVSAGSMRPGDVITWSGHTGFYIGNGQAISGNYGDAVRQHGSTAPGGIVMAGRPRFRDGGVVKSPGGFSGLPAPVQWLKQAQDGLGRLISIPIAPSFNSQVKAALNREFRLIDHLSYGQTGEFLRVARNFWSGLRGGGPKERATRKARVQQLIEYAGTRQARLIARPIGVSDSVQESISGAEGRINNQLILEGIDPESAAGRARKIALDTSSVGRLTARRQALSDARTRALRAGRRDAASQITREITEVDDQILGLRAEIKTLGEAVTDNTAAQEAANAQLEAQNALLKEQVANQQKALNVSQSQYGVLAKAIADVVSGQIGGRVGLGFQSPSTAGTVARY